MGKEIKCKRDRKLSSYFYISSVFYLTSSLLYYVSHFAYLTHRNVHTYNSCCTYLLKLSTRQKSIKQHPEQYAKHTYFWCYFYYCCCLVLFSYNVLYNKLLYKQPQGPIINFIARSVY